jgi:hypothetical protein
MKVDEKDWKSEQKIDVIRDKTIKNIEPLIIKEQGSFYENIGNSLQNKEFSNKNATQNEKYIWDYYANIVLIHEMQKTNSILKNSCIEQNEMKISELSKMIEVFLGNMGLCPPDSSTPHL